MNNSIQQLTAIAADLNAAGKEVNLKVLPTRRPRKGETWERQSQHGAGRAMGNAAPGGAATGATTTGGGKGMNLNRVYGYGARMVADLDATIARYNAQIRADKIADRRAERLGIA